MSLFTDAAASVNYCSRPVQLVGSTTRVDAATGELVSSYRSGDAPLGVTVLPCGNRRESVCVSCSRQYAADTFHLIRAGAAGGKGVPEWIGDNPLVFATLTAPSFGAVHYRDKTGTKYCRPRSKKTLCAHGVPTWCMSKHTEGDLLVGQPLCEHCYSYEHHVMWQWWAPELWRRFTITLKRALAAWLGVKPSHLRHLVTVSFAKVAEYQRRGIVHFHALIRVDGPAGPDKQFTLAPDEVTREVLASVVTAAAKATNFTAPALLDDRLSMGFGTQLDVRPVTGTRRTDDPDRPLTSEQVAGYIAKYASKSASDTVEGARDNAHYGRIKKFIRDALGINARRRENCRAGHDTTTDRAALAGYARLSKWVHTLGFRGHFSTKSRRYSVTLGKLRRARQRWHTLTADARRTQTTIDPTNLEARLLADDADDETTLIISEWAYVTTGWPRPGDATLANAAAARAREHAQHKTRGKKTS